MATKYEMKNNQVPHTFVSSNAYYGYVPKTQQANFPNNQVTYCHQQDDEQMDTDQQSFNNYEKQQIFNNNNNCQQYYQLSDLQVQNNNNSNGFFGVLQGKFMDKDDRSLVFNGRKRSMDNNDEITAHLPCRKRFKEGKARY